MGQVFDAEGNARQDDVDAVRQALRTQPAQCKPGAPQPARGPPPQPATECPAMKREHRVVVGSSWGTLSPAGQLRWQRLACDYFVAARPAAAAQTVGTPAARTAARVEAAIARPKGRAALGSKLRKLLDRTGTRTKPPRRA